MTNSKSRFSALALLISELHLCSCRGSIAETTPAPRDQVETQEATEEDSMLVQYLEIVNSEVDATCSVLAKVHGVTFGDPEALLGNARTAALKSGGRISVRAPMAEHDMPIVRPYVLVDDIEAAVQAAEAAGGDIAMGATEVPGHGKFAIYFLAGTQFGLWETPPSKASGVGVNAQEATKEQSMLVQYLEIVTAEVDVTCHALTQVHGVSFGEPEVALGGARTAALEGGGRISVRAPMAEHDLPIVRPYVLVDGIEAAVEAAEAAGGDFAMRTTEIPGHGKFAIYFLAGTQFGLWETPSTK